MNTGYWISQLSLFVFWIALIVAGIIKGYQYVALQVNSFNQAMEPILKVLKVFMFAGFGLAAGLTVIGCIMLSFIKIEASGDEQLKSG